MRRLFARTGPARILKRLEDGRVVAAPGSVVRASFKKGQRGQSMVEATLVLLVFFTMLLGVIDCGQVLFAHQSLVERVRAAVRWGVVHPWNGSDPIINLVLYGQTEALRGNAGTFLGLRPENVVVRHQAPAPDRPDDETLGVTIVNFRSQFFSPWIGAAVVSPRAVSITAPMAAGPALVQANYPQP